MEYLELSKKYLDEFETNQFDRTSLAWRNFEKDCHANYASNFSNCQFKALTARMQKTLHEVPTPLMHMKHYEIRLLNFMITYNEIQSHDWGM